MEKHGGYEFFIFVIKDKFSYLIMDKLVDRKIKVVSDELFEHESRARLAAIGHISLLEDKECLND